VTTGWLVLAKNDNKKQFKLQISIQEIAQFQLISHQHMQKHRQNQKEKKRKIKCDAFYIVIPIKNVAVLR
jgi:hypothetical protein